MKEIQTLRYNSNTGLGVRSDYFKDNIVKDNSYRGKLNLPKPQNNAEIALLSKFIFGTELSVKFSYCVDTINSYINKIESRTWSKPTQDEIKFIRFFKLWLLNPNKEDYLPKMSQLRHKNGKSVLLSVSYQCNQKHDDYYDSLFNYNVFKSCYELDSRFWRHCIGEVSCGGIGTYSYGQVEITSFKETKRILNIFKNPNETVRESFKQKIEKLIEEDLAYEKSMEV